MKQVSILAVLLGLALTGSYLTWTADDSSDAKADKVMVYRASADDIKAVTWKTKDTTTTVARRKDAKGAYVWVDLTETESTSFKGNKAADALWADLAPLYALRELQVQGSSSDTAFGFDDPDATVEIKRRSGPLTLLIGGETYGGKDRYVKAGDRVFLVDDKVMRPLQFAKTRLVDRMLHPVADSDAKSVTVRSGGREFTLIHGNKDDRAASFWALSDAPTEADGTAEAWLAKLMRMRVQVYAPEVDTSTLEPVFAYTIDAGADQWTVRVFQRQGETTEYFAHSDYTRATVSLTESLASEAIADLDSLLPPIE